MSLSMRNRPRDTHQRLIPLVILAAFSVVALVLLSPRQHYGRQAPHQNTTPKPKSAGLPTLYVDGNTIRRSDTNAPVRLKGVTTNLFVWPSYALDETYFSILDAVASWKINLLGLFIMPDRIAGRETDLDRIVEWGGKTVSTFT